MEIDYLQDPYSVYKRYVALKCHFTTQFDITRAQHTKNITRETYNKRSDKKFFIDLAKIYNVDQSNEFLLAQFVENCNLYGFEILQNFNVAKNVYIKWKERTTNILRNYAEDMNILSNISKKDWKKCFIAENGDYPLIFKAVTQKYIAHETYALLGDLFKHTTKEYSDVINAPLFNQINFKYFKYRKLIPITTTMLLELTPKSL
jgi:hypothetical protein